MENYLFNKHPQYSESISQELHEMKVKKSFMEKDKEKNETTRGHFGKVIQAFYDRFLKIKLFFLSAKLSLFTLLILSVFSTLMITLYSPLPLENRNIPQVQLQKGGYRRQTYIYIFQMSKAVYKRQVERGKQCCSQL